MKFIGFLLLPFSALYGFGVFLRNALFNIGILRQEKFDMPVISVGNLSVGGTGKTPQIEYLIRLLKEDYHVATLSRGYMRKTKGFILADKNSTTKLIGDEPKQYVQKFGDVDIAVDEKRRRGIKLLIKNKNPQVILLDDAFQHRYVKPGLSILLTNYHRPYTKDYLLPSGRLREWRSGAKRADIIVVTKTQKVLSPIIRRALIEEIKPAKRQKIFFSYIKYGDFVPLKETATKKAPARTYAILLFAGIAETYPLEEHLKGFCEELEVIRFPDHCKYKVSDMKCIRKNFDDIMSRNKIIVTTEKDAMRVEGEELISHLADVPVYYVPIEVEFHTKDKENFNKQIKDYVRKYAGKDKGNN